MRLLCFEARRRRRCRVAWLGWESKRSDLKGGFLLFVLPPSRCMGGGRNGCESGWEWKRWAEIWGKGLERMKKERRREGKGTNTIS